MTLRKIFETCKRQNVKILKILPVNSGRKGKEREGKGREKERNPIEK